jgi:hypothetical protein
MATNETVEEEKRYAMIVPLPQAQGLVEIDNAPPIALQTLDLARHVAIAPDGKKYVVATYNDTHMGRQYVTALYPQQNGYLTLFRLMIQETSSETAEQAIQKHREWVEAIQQGKMKKLTKVTKG